VPFQVRSFVYLVTSTADVLYSLFAKDERLSEELTLWKEVGKVLAGFPAFPMKYSEYGFTILVLSHESFFPQPITTNRSFRFF
jgi:hypothetical protein